MNDERSVLTELLRLYDWRFELARMEKDGDNPGGMSKLLNQYGREKKAAWEAARRVLSTPSAELPIGEQIARDTARDLDNVAAMIMRVAGGRSGFGSDHARMVTAGARMLERLARTVASSATEGRSEWPHGKETNGEIMEEFLNRDEAVWALIDEVRAFRQGVCCLTHSRDPIEIITDKYWGISSRESIARQRELIAKAKATKNTPDSRTKDAS